MASYYPEFVNGHVEYYDNNGQFLVSGDTLSEAGANLVELLVEKAMEMCA